MKVPANILWSSIGDVFSRTFNNDSERRFIELFWQTILENSSDNIKYVNHLKSLKSVMTASVYAPYGNMPVDARLIEASPGSLVRLQYLDGSTLMYYSNSLTSAKSIDVNNKSYFIDSRNTIELKSGGFITRTLINQSDELGVSDGYVFFGNTDVSGVNRWSDFLSYPVETLNDGLFFSPENIDISGVRDSTYFSGGYEFKLVFKGRISLLGDDSAIDVTSYSDIGLPYHIQIRKTELIDGLHGSENTQSISSPYGDFEIELIYDHVNKKMKSNVFIGEDVYETGWTSVSASRRNHSFVVINTSAVYLQYVVDKKGKRWNGESAVKDIYINSEEYPFLYSLTEPIVSCDLITTEPYSISIQADSESNVLSIDEEWMGYYPQFIRYGENFGSINESMELSGFTLEDGSIDLIPWYIKPGEYSFPEAGIIATKHRLPTESMYLRNAMAEEVDLYNRFGKQLGVPQKKDSAEYLGILRGVNYALRKSKTIRDIERACDMMIGLPFTIKGGAYTGYGSYVNQLSGKTKYYVDVDNERILIPDITKIKNEILDPMDSVVDGTVIEDWFNNNSIYPNDFSRWGKFKIIIPGYAGMSKFSSDTIVRTIKRARDVHKTFDVETKTEINEKVRTRDSYGIQSSPYSIEDLIFDDHNSVFGNPVGSENQDEADTGGLDYGFSMDFGNSLDSNSLSRGKAKIQSTGMIMGNYDREVRLLSDYLYYGDSQTDISRASDDPAFWGEAQLRIVDHSPLPATISTLYDDATHNYVPRARCIHWVYEDGTSEIYTWKVNPISDFLPASLITGNCISCDSFNDIKLVTNGVDVYEYDAGWDSTSPTTAINDLAYNPFNDYIICAGASAKVYTKAIGSPTWTDLTPSGSDDIFCISELYYADGDISPWFVVAGENGFVKVRDEDDSSWADITISTSESILAIHGTSDGNMFAVGTNGLIKKTYSMSSSWTDYTLPSTTKSITGVWHELGVDVAWCCADDGTIYKWNGVSWSLVYTASEALSSIFSGDGIITAVGDNGCVVRYTGYAWYEENPYSANDLNKVKNNVLCGNSASFYFF